MKALRTIVAVMVLLCGTARLTASGLLGVYAIVEKVVFEPNEQSPERIQVWGAFAYVATDPGAPLNFSAATRGYMYFRLPAGAADSSPVVVTRKEWADLKAVAGTGQAVGFGRWAYIGAFGGLQPDRRSSNPPYILEPEAGNPLTDLRARPASEAPASPALYATNAGIVKLSESGSHAAIVKQLKDALRR